jgi:hypothetical protein
MTDSQRNETWEPGTNLEIRFKFYSRSYSLKEFAETVEGIEALMVLSELDHVGLPWDADWRGQVVPSEEGAPKWYEVQRDRTSSHVWIEKVSLSTPLEVVIYVSAISSALFAMMRGFIDLKNRKHRSDQLAAETRRAMAKAESDTELFSLITKRITGDLPEEEFDVLMGVPVIRKAMNLALNAGDQVDSADIRPIQADPDVK